MPFRLNILYGVKFILWALRKDVASLQAINFSIAWSITLDTLKGEVGLKFTKKFGNFRLFFLIKSIWYLKKSISMEKSNEILFGLK